MIVESFYLIFGLIVQLGPSDAKFSALDPGHTPPQPSLLPSFGQPASSAIPAAPADKRDVDFPSTHGTTAQSIYMQQAGDGRQASTAIAQTGAQSPLVPVNAKTLASANTLIRRALTAPAKEPLQGKPVSLRTAIRLTSGTQQQADAVRAYWKLSFTIADYYYSEEEASYLMSLPIPQSPHHQALLTSLQACAKARQAESRLAVLRAQQDLAGSVPAATNDDLPLASDLPFVGAYGTHFDALNSHGVAPDHLRRIHRVLPVMHNLIDSRATAVFAAAEAVEELERAYEEGRVVLTAVLDSHERLRRQRREFLTTVRDYNEQIAQYAFSVALPGLTFDRIVGMLIEQPHAERSVLISDKNGSTIKRLSNEESIDSPAQFRRPLR